jgi:hypothetical protein
MPSRTGSDRWPVSREDVSMPTETDSAQTENEYELCKATLAELRLIRTRLALAITELDAIGIALSKRLISTVQAIALSNSLVHEFADRSYERDPYVEEFNALVEEKRAQYEVDMKRHRKRRRAV